MNLEKKAEIIRIRHKAWMKMGGISKGQSAIYVMEKDFF